MRNVIDIDGHKANVSFDPELRILRGDFLGLRGGADFYAETVEELYAEGKKSLRIFLDMCAEKDIEPFREFSGRFNIRLDPRTHEAAVVAATAENKSLNEWVAEAIETAAHS